MNKALNLAKRPVIYSLPEGTRRPQAKTLADQRRDHAIEAIIAGRMENYGESFERALCTLIEMGPDKALVGVMREREVSTIIRRSPEAIRDRVESAWATFSTLAGWFIRTGRKVQDYSDC